MTATTAARTDDTARAPLTDLMHPLDPGADAPQVADRLLAAALGWMELSAVHLGSRLGWYAALAEQGPLTSVELARCTGTAERYAREWLEQQASSGYLAVAAHAHDARVRSYALRDGAREALTDVDSLAYTAPLAGFSAASGRVMPELLEAYRTGGGVSWEQLGPDARTAQAAFNRPYFLHALTQESLRAVPTLHDRLVGGAAVADVGCGEGWSSIGLARAYDDVRVVGLDVDAPSVLAARRHASTAGLAERVEFTHVDAARVDAPDATFDVVTAFECVHDMSDPVRVLREMRRMVRDDGYVLVVDEATLPAFTPSAPPVERLFYGFSLLCCLADGLSVPGGAGTGTVMRLDVLEGYARAAGFTGVEVLPVEHDLFRFHRLHL